MNEEESEDLETDEIINALIEAGALELTSVDRDGDPVYRITEKCKDLFPDLYYEHMKNTDDVSFALWQKGLLEINFTDEGNQISMSPENYLEYVRVKDSLTEEEENLIFVFLNKRILDQE